MRIKKPSEIDDVPLPGAFSTGLEKANSLLIESLHRDGLPIESGIFDLGVVDKQTSTTLFFVRWVSRTNNVIDHLNLVVSDLRSLPFMFPILGGSPRDRYYLLVATYFHEFYRFREVFNQVVREAADRGYIERKDVTWIRQEFHDAFKPTIALRNTIVHGDPVWAGQRHFDLSLLGMATDLGYEIRDKETGKAREVREVLAAICTDTANAFREEGNRMSALQKGLIELYASLAEKAI